MGREGGKEGELSSTLSLTLHQSRPSLLSRSSIDQALHRPSYRPSQTHLKRFHPHLLRARRSQSDLKANRTRREQSEPQSSLTQSLSGVFEHAHSERWGFGLLICWAKKKKGLWRSEKREEREEGRNGRTEEGEVEGRRERSNRSCCGEEGDLPREEGQR